MRDALECVTSVYQKALKNQKTWQEIDFNLTAQFFGHKKIFNLILFVAANSLFNEVILWRDLFLWFPSLECVEQELPINAGRVMRFKFKKIQNNSLFIYLFSLEKSSDLMFGFKS